MARGTKDGRCASITGRLISVKALGSDGLPVEANREAAKVKPDLLLELMNNQLKSQEFLDRWKEAKLVQVPNGEENEERPMTYRPICLLDTLGKDLKP